MVNLRLAVETRVTQHLSCDDHQIAVYAMLGLGEFDVARVSKLLAPAADGRAPGMLRPALAQP